MSYVDGFLLPVPKRNLETYRRQARKAGKIWRAHGALDYVECVADDVKPGKWTSFPQRVKLKPGEFGAVEGARLPGPDGRLMHAMIRIGDSAATATAGWRIRSATTGRSARTSAT